MIKVLIADDEEMIRRGLSKLIQKDPEIEVVAEAEDGETAFSLAEKNLPDLLLIDINMPFLNGLEFIEKFKEIVEDSVIIVISGYDNFEYMQKALRLGVFDYLLKPVMEEPFFECINKAKEHLNKTKKEVKYLNWAKMQLQKNLFALKASFLKSWLRGHFTDTEINDQLEYLNINIPTACHIVMIYIYPNEKKLFSESEWDENLLYYAAENISGEVFETSLTVNINGNIIILADSQKVNSENKIRVKNSLEKFLPVDISVFDEEAVNIDDIPRVYENLSEALSNIRSYSESVKKTVQFIDENYFDPDISLNKAAVLVFMSPQYLSKIFKKETGITFIDYVTKLRIRKATALLSRGNLKIYEIAEKLGYANQHYFSSAFKRVLGISPNDYRRSLS